jgi:erythromycin esterase-like protein
MTDPAVALVRRQAVRLDPDTASSRILDEIDERASLVLIGDGTHGTQEFYRIRAEVTRGLIERRGFGVVAVEADWTDAYRANRWARLLGDDETAERALGGFTAFPRWMWRNREVVRFLEWLRGHNADRTPSERAGFYGLDLYGQHRSICCVNEYLEKVDPQAARLARQRYGGLDGFAGERRTSGYEFARSVRSCEDEVVRLLMDLQRRAVEHATRERRTAPDDDFVAERHARAVEDAEVYYRALFRGGVHSWNVRHRHMVSTLDALLEYAERSGRPRRAVVWAHNSHLGDARATGLAVSGGLNLGQLVRQQYVGACCLIGMTTHTGLVTAARTWGGPAERLEVRPSMAGSYERLFHETGIPLFMLRTTTPAVAWVLAQSPRLERAIGAIYEPETERASHCFSARLPDQFDLVVHVDETRALDPLETSMRHEVECTGDVPDGRRRRARGQQPARATEPTSSVDENRA